MRTSRRRPTAATLGRLLVATAIVAVAGCSTVLGIDSDRALRAPTDASPSPPPEAAAPVDPWACLDETPEPPEPGLQIPITLRVMEAIASSTAAGAIDGGSDLDTVSGTWLPGVTVRVCDLRDTKCLQPLTSSTTDDGGTVRFDLAGDFAGFFDLRRDDLVPSTLYPGSLLPGDTACDLPSYGITPSDLSALARTVTTEPIVLTADGGAGHALVTVYDCADHQAPGVSLAYSTTGPQTVPFYFKGGLPTTATGQTDGFGLGGAVDVPQGPLTVTASLTGDGGAPTMTPPGTTLGTTTFDVRPGAITFAWIRARSH